MAIVYLYSAVLFTAATGIAVLSYQALHRP